MHQVIAISGTPGTGKTVVGQLLAKRLGAKLLEVNQLVKEHKLLLGKDTERDTLIVDIEKLQSLLTELIRKSKHRYIVVSHFADVVPGELLEILIILRCHPINLIQRLRSRHWTSKKILENIQAEIIGECTAQALSRHLNSSVFEINTTNLSQEEVVTAIKAILVGKGNQYSAGRISWLRTLDPQLLYQIMEKNILPSGPKKVK